MAQLTNLEQLLERLDQASQGMDRVSLEEMVKAVGRRSFSPLLLAVGIMLVSPFSGIPGLPTTMGICVLLIAVQLFLQRDYFWLPQWLLRRSVKREKLKKAVKWLLPPARFIDRMIRPRLTVLLEGPSIYVIAFICLLFGLGLPFMELVPFSAHGAGIVLSAFSLSLMAHDGLLALIAFVCTLIVLGLMLTKLLL